MRLANEEPELHRAGAEIVALAVDSPGRNQAMRRRWHLPFPIISDPSGERLLQPIDAWDPDGRGGIAWPTVLVVAPDGREVLRLRSRDQADRPSDADVFAAVSALGLPPIELDPAPPAAEPEEHGDASRADALGSFFRGIRSGTNALSRRLTDGRDRDEALAMSAMASSFIDAWKERRSAATS